MSFFSVLFIISRLYFFHLYRIQSSSSLIIVFWKFHLSPTWKRMNFCFLVNFKFIIFFSSYFFFIYNKNMNIWQNFKYLIYFFVLFSTVFFLFRWFFKILCNGFRTLGGGSNVFFEGKLNILWIFLNLNFHHFWHFSLGRRQQLLSLPRFFFSY